MFKSLLYSTIFIFFISIPSLFIGQDRNIDRIEMLYDQENYNRVLRRINKLEKKENYRNNIPLKLFKSLSEYNLSKTNSKYSEKKALNKFRKFKDLDSLEEYRTTYAVYIYNIQHSFINDIIYLKKNNKLTEANDKYNEYIDLFDSKSKLEDLIPLDKPLSSNKEDEVLSRDTKTIQKNIIKEAKKHIGTPYKFGGVTPKGFDCSGFTQYVMARNGIKLPRSSKEQAEKFRKIKQKNARVGDLIFFGNRKNNINHVGIINKIDNNLIYMIHSSTSKGIMIIEVTTNVYWSKRIQFITRVL